MASRNKLKKIALDQVFRALADPTRLRLLNLMGDQELCVCFFVEVLNAPQPKISRHLAYLRRAGMVSARRDGKWMHYRITTPSDQHAAAILRTALDSLKQDREMQRDRQRLSQACCSPQSLVRLIGAPLPTETAQNA